MPAGAAPPARLSLQLVRKPGLVDVDTGGVAAEATVDGTTWSTSVWRGKDGRTLLAVPAKVRDGKGDGDQVVVELRFAL